MRVSFKIPVQYIKKVRFHQFGEVSPRHDPVDLFEKFLLLRLCFLQFVAQEGHVRLFIYVIILPQIS